MLTWNWENKIGTWTENQNGKEFTFNIYKCNGLAVILYEYEENGKELYQMHNFFVDKEHLKNMLGTGKNSEKINCFDKVLTKIELSQCKETQIILTEMLKAYWSNDLTIKLIGDCPFEI